MTNNELTFDEFLKTHEFYQLALVEAAHRFYYDHCFDKKSGKFSGTEIALKAANNLTQLGCLNPSWRYLLKKKLERYDGPSPTTALDIDSMPKKYKI